MTPLVDTLRKVAGRSDDVAARLDGLQRAVDAARGRLDPTLVDEIAEVADRASERIRLSADHTVVALAGATGSGKSSLFNDICGLDLAAVGVRRPTTSWALACAWGPQGADEILDWLGIPRRHQISRMGLLDESADDRDLQGLVLLDLPDHDSTEVSHHLEVQRLVKFADLMIWVLDPQKYADAAIHDRFLRPSNSHADVMIVAFNHIDEIPAAQHDAAISDVRRLLAQDGLADVPVFATSATRGDGVDELRRAIAERVTQKKLSRQRVSADVSAAAARLAEQIGDSSSGTVDERARSELIASCADAAGVPVVVEAIEVAWLARGRAETGWPLTRWLHRLWQDPLRKLHLDQAATVSDESLSESDRAVSVARTSMLAPTPVQRARVDGAVRAVADSVTEGMAAPWATAVRRASVSRLDDVSDALDKAVAETDLDVSRSPRWWSGARWLQWLLFVIALIGGLWLIGLAAFAFLQLPEPPAADWGGVPAPTVMLLGGVGLGILVTLGCRYAAKVSARRRAARADALLRTAIQGVTDDLVVGPMRAEVDAYARCRDGSQAALAR